MPDEGSSVGSVLMDCKERPFTKLPTNTPLAKVSYKPTAITLKDKDTLKIAISTDTVLNGVPETLCVHFRN